MSKVSFVIEDGIKKYRSENYNYNFSLTTGFFQRWGKTYEDDPKVSPFPEIVDFEVGTVCSFGCKFCYKSNTVKGHSTTFEDFKNCFDKFHKVNGLHTTCQIAFGIGDINSVPDLWKMMEYCRENYVIPNITINGDLLTDEIVEKLATLCGAISVSRYDNPDICYDAIARLRKAGCKQLNIHQIVMEESYDNCLQVIDDYIHDERLRNLNAIVFLTLKKKGRGTTHNILADHKYKTLINLCLKNNVPFGMDSCSSHKFSKVAKEVGIYEKVKDVIEPCESTIFSAFIDYDCKFYPCSFSVECFEGIDVTKVNNFVEDVWKNKKTCCERKKLLDNDRNCPYFEI